MYTVSRSSDKQVHAVSVLPKLNRSPSATTYAAEWLMYYNLCAHYHTILAARNSSRFDRADNVLISSFAILIYERIDCELLGFQNVLRFLSTMCLLRLSLDDGGLVLSLLSFLRLHTDILHLLDARDSSTVQTQVSIKHEQPNTSGSTTHTASFVPVLIFTFHLIQL